MAFALGNSYLSHTKVNRKPAVGCIWRKSEAMYEQIHST